MRSKSGARRRKRRRRRSPPNDDDGEDEPSDWTIVVEDPHPIAGGSPGLIGYSPVDIHYDNIRVTAN